MDSSPLFVLSTYESENHNIDKLGILDSRPPPVESDVDFLNVNPFLYYVVPDARDEGDGIGAL